MTNGKNDHASTGKVGSCSYSLLQQYYQNSSYEEASYASISLLSECQRSGSTLLLRLSLATDHFLCQFRQQLSNGTAPESEIFSNSSRTAIQANRRYFEALIATNRFADSAESLNRALLTSYNASWLYLHSNQVRSAAYLLEMDTSIIVANVQMQLGTRNRPSMIETSRRSYRLNDSLQILESFGYPELSHTLSRIRHLWLVIQTILSQVAFEHDERNGLNEEITELSRDVRGMEAPMLLRNGIICTLRSLYKMKDPLISIQRFIEMVELQLRSHLLTDVDNFLADLYCAVLEAQAEMMKHVSPDGASSVVRRQAIASRLQSYLLKATRCKLISSTTQASLWRLAGYLCKEMVHSVECFRNAHCADSSHIAVLINLTEGYCALNRFNEAFLYISRICSVKRGIAPEFESCSMRLGFFLAESETLSSMLTTRQLHLFRYLVSIQPDVTAGGYLEALGSIRKEDPWCKCLQWYSYLKAGSPNLVLLQSIQELDRSGTTNDSASCLSRIYLVEARLLKGYGVNEIRSGLNESSACLSSSSYIQLAKMNNEGILHLLEGSNEAARSSFRACIDASLDEVHEGSFYMEPYFNLALLNWKEGDILGALGVYQSLDKLRQLRCVHKTIETPRVARDACEVYQCWSLPLENSKDLDTLGEMIGACSGALAMRESILQKLASSNDTEDRDRNRSSDTQGGNSST